MTATTTKPNETATRAFWQNECNHGGVREVRIPKPKNGPLRLRNNATYGGYFDNEDAFVGAIRGITGADAQAVYVSLNPVLPDLLARRANRLDIVGKGEATNDSHIPRLMRLLIDCDPVRDTYVSATDDERQAALNRRDVVHDYLQAAGWPEPVMVSESGNGGHLVYAIDLPNDPEHVDLLKGCLSALDHLFSDEVVKIDTTTFNPSRITKIPGTIAAKGDNIESRPWRIATAEYHDTEPVSVESLQVIATEGPHPEPKATKQGDDYTVRAGRSWQIADVLHDSGIAFQMHTASYGAVFELDRCLTSADHTDGACIIEMVSGALAYKCQHDTCAGKKWADVRGQLLIPTRQNTSNTGNDDGDDSNDGEIPNVSVDKKPAKPSQATLLVRLVINGIDLFHDTDHVAYAAIPASGHIETWPVASKPFRDYLAASYYRRYQTAPGASSIADAITQLEGRANFDGGMRSVAVRSVLHGSDVFIDLGDDQWRAIRVTAAGWEIVTLSPVHFRRSLSTRPLPDPVRGGDVLRLARYANVAGGADGDDFLLLNGCIVAALLPTGPYPIFDLAGEQGGGKSTTARAIRRLTDPRKVEIASMPRDERDLASAAVNNRVLIFDNVSYVSDDRADALCRLATGGGWQSRKLYTDDDEHAIDAMCPVILTGIPDLATRPDLADRTITLEIPGLPRSKRQTEQTFWASFDHDAPAMFGALLDLLVVAMANRHAVPRDNLPRMADFATLGEAMLPAFNRKPGAFIEAMAGNQERQNSIILEAYPEAMELVKWINNRTDDDYTATASELLVALNGYADTSIVKSKSWPKTAKDLGVNLRRIAPNLKQAGLAVTFRREQHKRLIQLSKTK